MRLMQHSLGQKHSQHIVAGHDLLHRRELLVAQLRPAKRLFSDPPQPVGHCVHDRKRYPEPSW